MVTKKNGKSHDTNAPKSNKPATGSTGTRVRLTNDSGQILMFTKKVGKNGAIRVSATISVKGHKPAKVGRETFISHEDANKGMDKMVRAASEKGWTIKERVFGYSPAADKKIEVPDASNAPIGAMKKVVASTETVQ